MIYLIEDRDYLKIGYAEDVDRRFKQYKTYSLYPKLLAYKIGSMEDETKLHQLCEQWHVSGEWFKNCQEVKDIFDNYVISFDILKLKQIVCHNLSCLEKLMKIRHYGEQTPLYINDAIRLSKSQETTYQELLKSHTLTKEFEIWIDYYQKIIFLIDRHTLPLYRNTNFEFTIEYFFNRKFHIKGEIKGEMIYLNSETIYQK